MDGLVPTGLLLCAGAVGIPYVVIFVLAPILLGGIAAIRGSHLHFRNSQLYVGHVWHTRFLPKRHGFSYPIFMFGLDLHEPFNNFLWPMVQFRAEDHLKNGEGLPATSSLPRSHVLLGDRILTLVAAKTNNVLQPTLTTHRIILMTHLRYFGYTFNPVSFYYVIDRTSNELSAMVGEVSNTPWNEMHCYVLHPESVDKVQVKRQQQAASVVGIRGSKYEFRFPKVFHVSPFMEMEYWYDWTFAGLPSVACGNISVTNTMRRRSDDQTAFTAKMVLQALPLTPWRVVWQTIRFPVFCMIVQLWIHYQALWLFLKGIVYVPHPEGSETAASQAIAALMTPFFAIRDRISPKSKTQ